MVLMLVLFLPMFIAAGLLYLLVTLGDAVTTAATDWVESSDDD